MSEHQELQKQWEARVDELENYLRSDRSQYQEKGALEIYGDQVLEGAEYVALEEIKQIGGCA